MSEPITNKPRTEAGRVLLRGHEGVSIYLEVEDVVEIEEQAAAQERAAYAALAGVTTPPAVDEQRYRDDPVYHAIVVRIRQGEAQERARLRERHRTWEGHPPPYFSCGTCDTLLADPEPCCADGGATCDHDDD
jgi:hypothetical protein